MKNLNKNNYKSGKNCLVVLTNQYPYGKSETFLAHEILILSKYFEKIILLPLKKSKRLNEMPGNVLVDNKLIEAGNTSIFEKISQIFDQTLYKELNNIKNNYKLSISYLILKQCLASLAMGKSVAKRLHKLIKEEGHFYNEVILYSYWADETALGLALLDSNKSLLKKISRAHGWDVYFERRNTGFIPFRSLIFKKLNAVYFISEDGRTYTSQKFPRYANKFHLSRLGTLEGEILTQPASAPPFLLISTSNLIPLKRVHLIIDALAELDAPVHWVHFGKGPEQDRLVQQAQTLLGDKENVNWKFKGYVPNKQVQAYYQKQRPHLFLNVSSFEGLPVSIMEAMAHSIPVIATNVGGTSEIVRNKINGLLLSPNPTPQEISEAVSYFINLPEKQMTQYREKAHDMWQENFNAETNFRNFAYDLLQL